MYINLINVFLSKKNINLLFFMREKYLCFCIVTKKKMRLNKFLKIQIIEWIAFLPITSSYNLKYLVYDKESCHSAQRFLEFAFTQKKKRTCKSMPI